MQLFRLWSDEAEAKGGGIFSKRQGVRETAHQRGILWRLMIGAVTEKAGMRGMAFGAALLEDGDHGTFILWVKS